MYNGPETAQQLKQMAAEPIGSVIQNMTELHPSTNTVCPQLMQIPVYQQNKEGHCGFYMMHNAKTLVRALLARDKYT